MNQRQASIRKITLLHNSKSYKKEKDTKPYPILQELVSIFFQTPLAYNFYRRWEIGYILYMLTKAGVTGNLEPNQHNRLGEAS